MKVIREYLRVLKKIALILKTRLVWRRQNLHNFTVAANWLEVNIFPISKVKVGNYSYGPLRVLRFNPSDPELIIGSYVSIAQDVTFLLGGEHLLETVTTYPFKAKFGSQIEAISKGPIFVEDDVWIGYGATILSGVTLARGTIVAAGSVVVHSSEPYSVIGGCPAKLIKYRFDEETINVLKEIDFNKLDQSTLGKPNAIELLYTKIRNKDNAKHILNDLGISKS